MSFSDLIEQEVLNAYFGLGTATTPVNHLGLLASSSALGTSIESPTTFTSEVNGGAYVRAAAAGGGSLPTPSGAWGAASGAGVVQNRVAIQFPTATADWATGGSLVQIVICCNAPTNARATGNIVASMACTTNFAVVTGNTVVFAVGALTFNLD